MGYVGVSFLVTLVRQLVEDGYPGLEACVLAPAPLSWVVGTCSLGHLGSPPTEVSDTIVAPPGLCGGKCMNS